MHGVGNDFMIIDGREFEPILDTKLIKALANRNRGVGFDQLVVINKPRGSGSDCYVKFWNYDGSMSSTCGNASRCVADLIIKEKNLSKAIIETHAGTLICKKNKDGLISVNMGKPRLLWNEIPLAVECDTLSLPLPGNPVATNIGNPHCTFFVEDLEATNLDEFGKIYETHQLFPERVNIQLAQVLNYNKIRVHVWERGVGETLSSGSSSCAVAIAAHRKGLVGNETEIILNGGEIHVFWSDEGVWMTGETQTVFEGKVSKDFFQDGKSLSL